MKREICYDGTTDRLICSLGSEEEAAYFIEMFKDTLRDKPNWMTILSITNLLKATLYRMPIDIYYKTWEQGAFDNVVDLYGYTSLPMPTVDPPAHDVICDICADRKTCMLQNLLEATEKSKDFVSNIPYFHVVFGQSEDGPSRKVICKRYNRDLKGETTK